MEAEDTVRKWRSRRYLQEIQDLTSQEGKINSV